MCVVNFDECSCDCHLHSETGMMVMHCVPCCDGPCDTCGMFVRHGGKEEHAKQHDRLSDPEHWNPAEGGNKASDDYW